MDDILRSANTYFDASQQILDRIRSEQIDNLKRAAELCIDTIDKDGLVHLFGTGHSRIPIEEIFPRHGSFPGFHPIVELSLTHHTQVVGANGQRQAMLIERMDGLAEAILANFVFGSDDIFMIFSNSGVNKVIIEMALGVKERGMPIIAIVSLDHANASAPKHESGKRLHEVADIVIDNCVPKGDALVSVDGLDYPVGPASTLAYAWIVNAIKVMVADGLTQRGKPPLVLTSSVLIGSEANKDIFERTYNDYRARIARLYKG